MKNVIIAALILFTTMSYSQDKSIVASQYLEKISNTIRTNSGLKIDYQLKITNPDKNIGESDSGTVLLKESKFYLETNGNKIYSNGISRWIYMTEEEEVIIQNEGDITDDLSNPFAFLSNYKTNYAPNIENETTKNATISLSSKDKKSNIATITVVYDKQTEMPSMLRFLDKGSTSFTINIYKVTKNQSFTKMVFEPDFSNNKNIEIIDQR